MRNPALMNDVPSTAADIGRVVGGRYRLERVLGQGGMGVVFAATQEPLMRSVVVKLIRASSSSSPTGGEVARFVKEAEMLARFAHPHIVQLYDQGEHNGEVFLVMEHLSGRTLSARIEEGPLPWRFALTRMRQVALALAEAHAHGVVHRDLKPNNVFLVEHRGLPAQVKVLDFGLARLQVSTGKSLTETGELLGTPGYISPEQIEGAPATEKSDLYALGVVLYECLTANNPFVAETPVASLMRHLKFKAPPPSTAVPDVPERVDELVRRLLQKEPALRPKTADDVIAAIDDVLAADGAHDHAVDGAVTQRVRHKSTGRAATALRAAVSFCALAFAGAMVATMPSSSTRALTSTDPGRIQAIDPLQPPVPQPPAVVALGRALFIEPRLSKSERISCATCHSEGSGTTPESRTLLGETGKRVKFNTPSTWNAPTLYRQTWTGEVEHLEDVLTRPIANPDMMASSWELVVSRLRGDSTWAKRFKDAGVDVDEAGVKRALVSYMTATVPVDAAFDRYLRGDASAITSDVRRGAELFAQYGCSSCHQGKAVGGNMQAPFGVMTDPYVDRGVCDNGDYCRVDCADGSTCAKPAPVTAADAGAGERRFRVPSLRNVALTGPYFHDGSARTLDEAVDVMARVQLGLTLSAADRASLAAFLQSLTGERGRP
jgi:cytochrome c peroxidase